MKILIVDDSSAMRMIVRRTLRQAGFDGHDIVEAGNGREALLRMREGMPDMILSDWNMPDIDGMALLTAVRAAKLRIPFGFITAQGSPEMRERARSAGANFLISKPFTDDVFRDIVGPYIQPSG
jgi:two-component system chemotaxis response regulator CheY